MKGKQFRTMTFCLLLALAVAGCAGPGQAARRPAAELEQETATAVIPPPPTSTPLPDPDLGPSATGETDEPPVIAQPAESSPEPATPPSPLHPFQLAQGRPRVVVIDPGHGGDEVGAAGAGLAEKNVNLDIALRLRELLEQDGLQVVLTRDSDRRVCPAPGEERPQGYSVTRADLQCRIDIANDASADVFLSIHHNGSNDSSLSGTEIWYDGKRPFAAFNQALAEQVLSSLVETIRAAGYPDRDRGIKEDSDFRTFNGRQYPLFVLGPPRTGQNATRAGQMPAILGETLFLSNPWEAQQLTRDEFREVVAQGYHDGLLHYFQLIDDGTLAMPAEGWQPEEPVNYPAPPRSGP